MFSGRVGLAVARRASCALLIAAGLGTALQAAQPESATSKSPLLETNFLVIPNKPYAGPGAVPPASDLRATVGKLELDVQSVTATRDRLGQT